MFSRSVKIKPPAEHHGRQQRELLLVFTSYVIVIFSLSFCCLTLLEPNCCDYAEKIKALAMRV